MVEQIYRLDTPLVKVLNQPGWDGHPRSEGFEFSGRDRRAWPWQHGTGRQSIDF